jgi:hypothetical protein
VQAIAAAAWAALWPARGLRRSAGRPHPEHRAIARDAWRVELVTPRTMLESMKVLRVGPREIAAAPRRHLSVNEPLPRLLAALGLFDRSKAPGPDDMAVTQQVQDFNAKIEATPAFFWMVTEGNDRATQVGPAAPMCVPNWPPRRRACPCTRCSRPAGIPRAGAPLRRHPPLVGAQTPGQTVQMWARLGYAPPVGAAPRRGLEAHLIAA